MSYIAIWPYLELREGQVIEGGRGGFRNWNLQGLENTLKTLEKYGIILPDFDKAKMSELKSLRRKLKTGITLSTSSDEKIVLNWALNKTNDAIKEKGGGFLGGSFWESITDISGVPDPDKPAAGTPIPPTSPTTPKVTCDEDERLNKDGDCVKKNNLPLILGISAGALVIAGIITFVIIKNRN